VGLPLVVPCGSLGDPQAHARNHAKEERAAGGWCEGGTLLSAGRIDPTRPRAVRSRCNVRVGVQRAVAAASARDTVLGDVAACIASRGLLEDNRRMESVLAAIGSTPMLRLRRCAPPNGAELWVKLEYRNPTGSMKDRMALAMIEGAERDGLISGGDTVVEYTGGSTGPALALVCQAKGYRALIVMADCFTEERFQLMRALGAEIDVIPSVEGPPKITSQDIHNMVAARDAQCRCRDNRVSSRRPAGPSPDFIPGG
jgi:hypothetical protein